jgi:16S rRNA (adenine1518-N6/adenine1519-N6)-dimethyltransferase
MGHPLSLPGINVPELLHQYDLRPNKKLGQNFLLDESILERIVQTAQVEPNDVVLEVGAGLGSLTRHLALRARLVIAVELDAKLIPPLTNVTSPFQNVRVVEGDILSLDINQLVTEAGFLIVANIPYYITSALIRHLLEAKTPPRRIILTVQQEVAKRICATPGDMNLLALSVQVYGRPALVFSIASSAFFPSPKVDSQVINIELYPSPVIPVPLLDIFFKLIKAGFSQRRKTLRNALSGGLRRNPAVVESFLNAAGIEPRRRAETLSLDEWKSLTLRYHDDLYDDA